MSDIFISYARSTADQAQAIAEALRGLGYAVWRDDELPAHRSYADVIEERLRSAKAVVVIWSVEAARSQWVRAEANVAREAGTLVQLRLDGAVPPLPFNEIQCADMTGWAGDLDAHGWKKVVASVGDLIAGGAPTPSLAATQPPVRKLSICVLPFANISDDPQQEYFSDGISEDIITDLSKVSALFVVARNTAFQFKDKTLDMAQLAGQLGVSHVLEGSVRKAGGRVRITAQLIDGSSGGHLWAERYDRDLTDIFALQDEISEAIVKALKLRLLPEEKQAIVQRGTDNADAYNLYLMARQSMISGNAGDPRREETILRLTRGAVELDPSYAQAWALMARAQRALRYSHGRPGDDGLDAAERALTLNPNLAEAHAVKARCVSEQGRLDEADAEVNLALRLDPGSYEANDTAGDLAYRARRLDEAAGYYERAAALMEAEVGCGAMLVTCYQVLGDEESMRRAARMTLARAEKALAQNQGNGSAMGWGVTALAALGEAERAKDWIRRALLVDPDNILMRYNFACAVAAQLRDVEGALELLGPFFENSTRTFVKHVNVDPDMDTVRDNPRFQAMIAKAEARLAAAADGPGR